MTTTQSTQLTKTEEKKSPAEVIKTKIRSPGMAEEWKKALPAHVPVERFQRIVVTAVATNSDLLRCRPDDLFAEFMKCAQDGLVPDGREATILVYGKDSPEPKYSPMIGGICKKARQSGEILTMDAQVVKEKDQYESWIDEKGPHFKHVKARGDRGEDVLTYAYATTKDGGYYHEEIDEAQMIEIEKCSRARTGPWKGPFRDEMKRKSALRRLGKYRLPSSTDLDQVLRRDDELFDLNTTQHVTSGESAKALAARNDFLPGISPPKTAEQYVAMLKDVPGGRDILFAQLKRYFAAKDGVSHGKLAEAMERANVLLDPGLNELPDDENASPPYTHDDDIRAAVAETDAKEGECTSTQPRK
jgi:phage RecT family recombinase